MLSFLFSILLGSAAVDAAGTPVDPGKITKITQTQPARTTGVPPLPADVTDITDLTGGISMDIYGYFEPALSMDPGLLSTIFD